MLFLKAFSKMLSRMHGRNTAQRCILESGVVGLRRPTITTAHYSPLCRAICRMCNEFEETIDHIVAGCPVLANTEYIQRHDKAAGYLHWRICKHYHFPTADKWYEHKPEKVTENEAATVLWDRPVNTGKEIKANRPDIIIKDKIEKKCIMIDI